MINAEEYQLVRSVIGINIATIRRRLGYSQSQLAKTVAINRTYINQLESGKRNVTVDILVKVADGLDVPLPNLLAGLHAAPPYKLEKSTVKYELVGLDENDAEGGGV